jgi:hypothetical protein
VPGRPAVVLIGAAQSKPTPSPAGRRRERTTRLPAYGRSPHRQGRQQVRSALDRSRPPRPAGADDRAARSVVLRVITPAASCISTLGRQLASRPGADLGPGKAVIGERHCCGDAPVSARDPRRVSSGARQAASRVGTDVAPTTSERLRQPARPADCDQC